MLQLWAVYLCGDAIPSALFLDKEDADGWPDSKPRWMDKEIKEVISEVEWSREEEA